MCCYLKPSTVFVIAFVADFEIGDGRDSDAAGKEEEDRSMDDNWTDIGSSAHELKESGTCMAGSKKDDRVGFSGALLHLIPLFRAQCLLSFHFSMPSYLFRCDRGDFVLFLFLATCVLS